MNEKTLMAIAKGISWFCSPFAVPTLSISLLFLLSYLRLLPWSYKLLVILAVFCFTYLMPKLTILLYRKMNGWNLREFGTREKRLIPYLLTIISYGFCLTLLEQFNVPRYMGGIVIASLMALILCAIINIWWKISAHMVSIGGSAGLLICFGELFNFNPITWLSLVFLLAGFIGSSRITLRMHSLNQVMVGFFLGIACSITGILVYTL